MFPLSAEDNSKKKKVSSNVFFNAFALLSACVIIALAIFYFFPELIIRIFAGRYIPQSSSILFFIAIATSLLSLTNLILLYKIASGKLKGYQYLFIFLALQIFLLFFFSNSLLQFSIAFVTASAAFFWGSIILMNE
jgi:O-antigen/teichoic acid export membrane protein